MFIAGLAMIAGIIFFLVKLFEKPENTENITGIQSKTEDNSQVQIKKPLTINEQFDFKNIAIPQYVDTQLIPVGEARIGQMLDSIKNIVIHYTGNPQTTAQNNHDYYTQEGTVVCSHFVVGIRGEIIQCVPLNERSAASNHRNKDTISIEVCHPDKSGKFTDASYNSTVKLTAWLCKTFDLKSSDVIRHYDITGKECPRYYVKNPEEWKKFISDVDAQIKH